MKLAKDETAKLVTKTDVSNFRRNFKKYFLFFKVKNDKVVDLIEYLKSSRLFKEIECTNLKSRKKRKRYIKSQVHELNLILEKYQDQHLIIQKILKIPTSSF